MSDEEENFDNEDNVSEHLNDDDIDEKIRLDETANDENSVQSDSDEQTEEVVTHQSSCYS